MPFAPKIGAKFSSSWNATFTCSRKVSGSANLGFCEPRTVIAFNFLAPKIAPAPARALARPLSFMIAANRTNFSPAGPMERIRTFESLVSFLTYSSVAKVSIPQRCSADSIFAVLSRMFSITGIFEAPVIRMPSNPVWRNSAPK